MLCTLRSCSHWPAKFATRAWAFGSASIRRTCCSSTSGSCSVPASAASSRASSGMLLHRKNERRDASSMPLIGWTLARARARGITLGAEYEPRARQDRVQRSLDAGVEPAFARPALIERHQRSDVGVGDGLPVGAARERLDESRRAHASSLGTCAGSAVRSRGRQTKMRLRLGVSPGPVGVERSSDSQRLDMRQAGPVERID